MPDIASSTDATPFVSREQMRLVLEVARSLAVSTDLDALLFRIARAATEMLGCERASVFLHDPRKNELWTKVALQSDPIRVPVDSGIVGHAFKNNQIVHSSEAYSDPRFNFEPDRHSGFVTRDLLAAPMVDWDDKPVGVLQAVNKITAPFDDTDAALLRLLADQAGVAVQRWNLQQQAIESLGLRHEMHLARQVQEAMIPTRPPTVPGVQCAGWTRPASINGGDCYDLWASGDRLGILVADASGHGIAPALVVSQVRALVRVLSETEKDPMKILTRIDERLAIDLQSGRFVTAFLGFLAPDGWLHWCSAGHGPSVLYDPAAGARVIEATWPPLGWMQDAPGQLPDPIYFAPGASLIALSDGITEAFAPDQQLFGINKVVQILESTGVTDPAATIGAVREAVYQWQGHEDPADDQTIVVIRRG